MTNIKDVQDSNLHKRVVTLIKQYPQPKEIYQAITTKQYPYSPTYQSTLTVRDRALMAFYYASAGRGAEVCGGAKYSRGVTAQKDNKGKNICVICGTELAGNQRKFCCKEHRHQIKSAPLPGECHLGILAENVSYDENRILIKDMPVVKRSPAIKEKYGPQATLRQPFAIPLKKGLYENQFFDQLVPFAWLIKDYLAREDTPKEGKLFRIKNKMAYKIVREVTGNYLNWFRAMGKQFYGQFLFERNAVELAEFVNDQDSESERPYTRYDWTTRLKDKTMIMDFDWIERVIP